MGIEPKKANVIHYDYDRKVKIVSRQRIPSHHVFLAAGLKLLNFTNIYSQHTYTNLLEIEVQIPILTKEKLLDILSLKASTHIDPLK